LLRVAAMFQIADGVQTVAAGALRGLGDTRTPFLLAAFGYWAVGFPAAWFLTLHTSLGAAGAWWGLAVGLITVATLLTARFLTRTATLRL
jgi:MATE family multidrug resistance protein